MANETQSNSMSKAQYVDDLSKLKTQVSGGAYYVP